MKYQYFTLATVIKPYLLSFIFFFAAQIMAIAQVPTPTIALTTDTGSSSTDGITNDASVNISGLNVGSFYEFSRDGGVTWVPLGLASGASATFSALSTFSSGTLDSNPTISKTAPSTSVEATLEPYSSGDSPDSFYFDVTMPATFGTDSEILFESGAIGVGASIFVEGADLKISIGSDNNASDLSATGVFETNKRYGIIVELLTDKSVKFYVIEKGGQLPSSFGVAIAASASGLWDSRWSGANGAGWGYYDGLEQAQRSSTNNYAGFSGTFHEGMFFDQKGFSDIWTDGSQGNDLTVLDNVEVVARQTIENSGKSTVSNPLTITYDETPPSITSSATATSIDENSGASQVIYTVITDETATYSLGSAGGDESAFSIDGTTGEVTLTADPDYETKSSYSFEVVATDAAGNASQQTVTLAINDLNDNAPVFSSGSTVSVAEGQTATGYTAAATDADAGSTIGYTITGGLDHTLFDIDQTSGELTFKVAPDYEAPSDSDEDNAYVVEVEATDGLHGTTQTVTVTVTDIVDEMAPMLDTVEASSDGGQIILTLTESVVENGTVNASDFVLTIDNVDSPPTVTNITVSTSTVSLTLSEALSIAPGTNITLTYTKSGDSGTIEDSVGNRLADFSQQSVDIGTLEFKVATKAEILFNNPVRTSLHITSDEKLYQLRIFSINGRKVLEKGLNTNSQSVDLSTLPAGIYLLELATETHVKRGKLLKM